MLLHVRIRKQNIAALPYLWLSCTFFTSIHYYQIHSGGACRFLLDALNLNAEVIVGDGVTKMIANDIQQTIALYDIEKALANATAAMYWYSTFAIQCGDTRKLMRNGSGACEARTVA